MKKEEHIDLTAIELARVLKVDTAQIVQWLSHGLPYYTMKGIMLFKHDDVLRWMVKNKLT